MDTQTPRTDAEKKWTFGDNRPGMSFECVKVEFAHELEKELAEAKRLLVRRVEATRLEDAERRFQYQKDENDNRIKQIRKLQQELHELHTKDSARTREYNVLVQENRDLHKQLADAPKMLGMATDLNLLLQNKADMWRDEFTRIKALCHGKPLEWLEVEGICDRAMQDIRSNISLIDQRERAADVIAKLNEEATATEALLRTYGWKEDESLQMFLHRMKQRPCDPMNHSPEYLASLLQDCENKLTQATDEIARLRDYIDHAQRTLNAAMSASENDKADSPANPKS